MRRMPMQEDSMIDFDKAGGLVAGIVQDAQTGEVLMLGFLNEESFDIRWRPAS